MSKTSKYFIKCLKDHQCKILGGDSVIFGTRAVALDKHGKLHMRRSLTHCHECIFGESMNFEMRYATWFNLSSATPLVFPFKHAWKDPIYAFELNYMETEDLAARHKFFENVLLHMLHLLDAGNDIYLGSRLFLKKNTAYIHRMNIDLMADE